MFSNPLQTTVPLGNRDGDRELAQLMTSFWISFIHDLDPNHSQGVSSCLRDLFLLTVRSSGGCPDLAKLRKGCGQPSLQSAWVVCGKG